MALEFLDGGTESISSPQRFSFSELPIGAKFRGPDGDMYLKIGANDILRMRLSRDGGIIGAGATLKWNPEWQMSFQRMPEKEVAALSAVNGPLKWVLRRLSQVLKR